MARIEISGFIDTDDLNAETQVDLDSETGLTEEGYDEIATHMMGGYMIADLNELKLKLVK